MYSTTIQSSILFYRNVIYCWPLYQIKGIFKKIIRLRKTFVPHRKRLKYEYCSRINVNRWIILVRLTINYKIFTPRYLWMFIWHSMDIARNSWWIHCCSHRYVKEIHIPYYNQRIFVHFKTLWNCSKKPQIYGCC